MEEHFKAKKSLGQHFLTNPKVPELMADASELQAGDTVFEIGPGTGVLTREFLKRDAKVIAVEADERAVALLEKEFADEIASGNFVLHHGDIKNADIAAYGLKPHQYKLIANIPYYLSGILFRQFLQSNCQPESLVFLTQKEVAERIVRDKKESLLSLSVKVYGIPSYVRTVSKGNFSPQPNVDSAIIKVASISKENFKNLEETFFFELLHLGFAARRKQLLGNLAKQFDRDVLAHIFSTLHIKLDARGEDLSPQMWLELAAALSSHT